jgi:hypothetical protein
MHFLLQIRLLFFCGSHPAANLREMQASGNPRAAVATALWAVSIMRKALEMNRPLAGGYRTYEIAEQKERPRNSSLALFDFR